MSADWIMQLPDYASEEAAALFGSLKQRLVVHHLLQLGGRGSLGDVVESMNNAARNATVKSSIRMTLNTIGEFRPTVTRMKKRGWIVERDGSICLSDTGAALLRWLELESRSYVRLLDATERTLS